MPVDAEESSFRKDTDHFYVILGNGAAGLSAAKAIRERDKTGSVIMISNEAYPTYNRPMLTKSMVAELDAKEILVDGKDADSYEEVTMTEAVCVTKDNVDERYEYGF